MSNRIQIGFLLNTVLFYLIINQNVLGDLQPFINRAVRSIGGMNPGNQNPGGFVQGANHFVPSDNLRNPERPQLESIYRGKVVWGNVSANDLEKKDAHVYQQGYNPDRDRDKFGNPIIPSEEIKRRPRPRVQPKRKVDVDEGKLRRKRAIIQELNEHKSSDAKFHFDTPRIIYNERINTKDTDAVTLNPEQKIKCEEFNKNQNQINDLVDENLDKSINTFMKMMIDKKIVKKREVGYEFDEEDTIGQYAAERRKMRLNRTRANDVKSNKHDVVKRAIESIYKGPIIESIYKGPVIESKYNGPVIRSQYTGPQIRSEYKGPIIRSEYKGKVIAIHKDFMHELEKNDTEAVQTVLENMAQKYERMNQENNMMGHEPIRYFKRKNAAVVKETDV